MHCPHAYDRNDCRHCAEHPTTPEAPNPEPGKAAIWRHRIGVAAILCAGLAIVSYVLLSFLNAEADAKQDRVSDAITSADAPYQPDQDEPIPGASSLNPLTITPTMVTDWPFSIDRGLLACDLLPPDEQVASNQRLASITLEAEDGTVYALNGIALSRMEENGWHDAREIWVRGDLGLVIDLGHEIC